MQVLTPERTARLAATLHAAGVPGAALTIRHRDTTETVACGLADIGRGTAATADTVFHLFSGTKLYTAAAVMRLVEDGLVELDAPVTRYLPALRLAHPVTLRQLASHASGLPETVSALLAAHFAGEPMPDTASALARFRTTGGKAPGRTVAYRNVNYAILGEVISVVSGTPYTEYVTREILTPLGSRAAFDYTPDTRARAATGYIPRFEPMRWAMKLLMPGMARRLEAGRDGGLVRLNEFALDTAAIGGLVGTVADFLPLLVEMLTPGEGVLRADSKRMMLTMQAAGAAGIASTAGVGLGWKLGRADGTAFWNHEGGGPGFTSETRVYPDAGLGMVLLMNATQTRARSLAAHAVCEQIRRATSSSSR
jgi:D-alanyl-D-alanine carboxypeptidase